MPTVARVVVAALALTIGVGAQQKPNFSGRWVVVTPKEGAGQEQIVTHTDKTLTTQHASEGPAHKLTYQLDGVERRLALPSHGSEIVILAKASWDADRVVIIRNATYPNGMKTQSRDVWSLNAQGQLIVDSSETGPGGEKGPVVKIVYAKKR
jgi:hypothetical protein